MTQDDADRLEELAERETAYGLFQRAQALQRKRHNAQAAVLLERADRLEGGLAVDFLASAAGRTDTLILADATVRSSPLITGNAILDVEVGARQRIGIQTVAFGVIGSQISDTPDRPRLRLRLGLSHFF